MSDMGAREAAARALMAVERGGYSNLVMARSLAGMADARERRFASAIASGALERLITLDYILSQSLSKPLAKLDAEVRAALRTGLCQCLFMNVPARAAISESVELCRVLSKSSAAGLVNAVLRKASAFDLAEIDNIKDESLRRSVKYSLCEPLGDMLAAQYGEAADGIMAAFFARPRDCARVNTLRTDCETLLKELESEGITARRGSLENSIELVGEGWLSCSALARGDMRIQSESAQRAALALGAKAGMRVLDMCSAPGGKTLTAAQQMQNQGEIVALDRSAKRLALLERQAALEGVSIVKTLACDAREYESEAPFDAVLCDVPCSGYGETASKPELRYKSPEGNEELYEIQRAILQSGARALKAGGRLIYSTCTLDCRENEQIVDAFLNDNPNFSPDATNAGGKYTKKIPGENDPEGFFIATFVKVC